MSSPLLRGALCAALGSALLAQGSPVNCIQHARVDKFPGAPSSSNNYAGLHGMVINGTEYAIVTARTGTIIYDCSNPASPVERGFIAGPGGSSQPYFWREANGLGSYAYTSSEHGPLQVIDLTNPNAPVLAGTFGGTAHSLSIDPGAKTLWANGGAGNGCRIYNLATSATNPPQITSFSSPYVHDCLPIRGYCYLACINNGQMRILATANLPALTTLSQTTTPGRFTHNVGVTDDDKIAVTTDENSGGGLGIYDISNKSAPVLKSTWKSPDGATVHNVIVQSQVAHVSSYTAGYYAVDISIPTAPAMIAKFDTSASTGAGYSGAWGAFPQPSGKVYLSDMQRGFFVVEPTCGVPVMYGAGTAGTGGSTPSLDYGGGFAQVGRATFQLVGARIAPGAQVALLVGAASGSTPLLGVTVLVDLTQSLVVVTGQADASGKVAFAAPIPNQPGLANGTIWTQLIAVDSGGPQGLSASPGMKVTVCP